MCLVAGEKDFGLASMPLLSITSCPELWRYLPDEDLEDHNQKECDLQVAGKIQDPKGERISGKDWPRPPKGAAFLKLRVGVRDLEDRPKGAGMQLEVFMITALSCLRDESEGAKDRSKAAAQYSSKFASVYRCPGEKLVFSAATARAWDQDPKVLRRKSQKGRSQFS